MNVVCGPCAAEEASLWISGSSSDSPPPVTLFVEGGPQVPCSLDWQVLSAASTVKRDIGILRLRNLQPGMRYRAVLTDEHSDPLEVWPRTLPARLHASGMAFVLASCYYGAGDEEGGALAALRKVEGQFSPTFKLLVGDQVYADVPPFEFLPFGTTGSTPYLERYDAYWTKPAYREFLRRGPSFYACDDHEWWNNAPELQPHLSRTWTRARRKTNLDAGRLAYSLYQVQLNAQGGFWYTIDIPPISIFVADTRSERDEYRRNNHTVMLPAQAQALAAWARGLSGPGFLVLGQPLFGSSGNWMDYNLPDYDDDYRLLWDVVETAPHQITILSGDIHVGRLARSAAGNGLQDRPGVLEFVSSPLSLVEGSNLPFLGGHSNLPAPEIVSTNGGLRRGYRRSVETLFGTEDLNLGVVRLTPTPNSTSVRAEFVLWSITDNDVARDESTGKECWQRDEVLT